MVAFRAQHTLLFNPLASVRFLQWEQYGLRRLKMGFLFLRKISYFLKNFFNK